MYHYRKHVIIANVNASPATFNAAYIDVDEDEDVDEELAPDVAACVAVVVAVPEAVAVPLMVAVPDALEVLLFPPELVLVLLAGTGIATAAWPVQLLFGSSGQL